MDMKVKQSWPIWLGGVVFCLYGIFLPMHKLLHVIIAACVAIVVYIIADKIAKPTIVHIPVEESLKKTGDNTADDVINAARGFLGRLEAAKAAMRDDDMKWRVGRWIETARDILKYVAANPQTAKSLRTFMDYYFPQAVKLAESYVEFEGATVKTESVIDSMRRIEGAADNVASVFKNQLNGLYEDKTLDIRTDIEVLKGLSGGK